MFWQLQLGFWLSVRAFDRNCLLPPFAGFKRIHNNLWRLVCEWWQHNDGRRGMSLLNDGACTVCVKSLVSSWYVIDFIVRRSHFSRHCGWISFAWGSGSWLCSFFSFFSCCCCFRTSELSQWGKIRAHFHEPGLVVPYFCGSCSLRPRSHAWPCAALQCTLHFVPSVTPFFLLVFFLRRAIHIY